MPDKYEIESLELFDTEVWTRKLENLPLSELYEFMDEKEFYRYSVMRVKDLVNSLDHLLVGKTELVRLMAIATIAQLPMLILGTWGTAKSLVARKFAEGLGILSDAAPIGEEDELVKKLLRGETSSASNVIADHLGLRERRYFEYLVTRFTTPEEILGGVNIDVMLKQAVHLRSTRGFMPRAEIVFLDEIFKANSAILNSLLSLINERIIHNAGVAWRSNLMMLFAASNEPPQEKDLGAFYDRFPIRALSDSVGTDEDAVKSLLDHTQSQAVANLAVTGDQNNNPGDEMKRFDPDGKLGQRQIKQVACVNDFRLLNKISGVSFGGINLTDSSGSSKEFLATFIAIFRALRKPYDISDRAFGHYYRMARANAMFREADHLEKMDCGVFYYVAKDPDEARKLPGIVDQLIG